MTTPLDILVIEDETPIRVGLLDVLAFHGYRPEGASDGRTGLALASTGRFPLVLLDVMLPEMDGFTVCRSLREARPGVSILMLTAKGGEHDILTGFEAGADDYVTKPFSPAQLMARVRALLRRHQGPEVLELGPVSIHPDERLARGQGTQVELTARECELLAYLQRQRGRAVDREELLREVWGYERTAGIETRSVDMIVMKLRKKLAAIGGERTLETIRGTGYRLP